MDIAVAVVQAYLQVNGYFTVVEYPVLEGIATGGTRTVTDIDVLAFRFPGAGCEAEGSTNRRADVNLAFVPDDALEVPGSQPDMIIGEVKEGAARFNPAARDPAVLAAALSRFGCCQVDRVQPIVQELLSKGRARTPADHQVRMVAFGHAAAVDRSAWGLVVPMDHVFCFLRSHLRSRWTTLQQAQFKNPVLGLLALMQKVGVSPAQSRGRIGSRGTDGGSDEN